MILINHPRINDIAAEYAADLFKQFDAKRKIFAGILRILLSEGQYERNIHSNIGTPILKLILKQSVLEVPRGMSKENRKDIFWHNIDKHRISIDKRSECRKKIRYDFIEKQLNIIFNSGHSLKELFSADIGKLKAINKHFDDQDLDLKVYEYFFNYEKYYETLSKYIGQELGIICCPYCNRNYISYVFNEKGRIIGPTYDHFFNKGAFKFCSLSFFNLIPSCYVCNSNLKNRIKFDLATHLYPYRDEFGKNAFFDFDLSLISLSTEKKIIFRPVIKYADDISDADKRKLAGDAQDLNGEVTGSVKVFKLQEIYETHYDTVEEVHEKFDANSPYYIGSIEEKLKLLGVGKEEFYRFHFHNYYDSSDFHKRPLAKLSRDIFTKMEQIQNNAVTGS